MCRIIFLVILLCSTPAWAEKGFYVGLGMGQSHHQLNHSMVERTYGLTGSELQSSVSVLSLLAAYRYDDLFAMEFEFLFPGSVVAQQNGIKQKLFTPDVANMRGVLGHNLSSNLRVMGGLGVSSWMMTDHAQDVSIDEGIGLSYHLGLDINLYGGRERVIRVLWSHQNYDNVLMQSGDTLTLSVIFAKFY